MTDEIYDEAKYKAFVEEFHKIEGRDNIKKVKLKDLKKAAVSTGAKTRFGALGWRSTTSSRMAQKTVYLGSQPVRLPSTSPLQENLIKKAPEELDKVLHLLKSLPFVSLTRQMGNNSEFNPICHYYISVADKKNYRLPYMWGNTMAKVSKRPGPHFHMIQIPEEHLMRQQILTIPEHNFNIALGSDYMGEIKKGFLRQAMWWADEHGMLGLHAGSKIVTAYDPVKNRLKRIGVLMFGLTATGKSTWSCHQLGMDYGKGENTEVSQDDIVFLKNDGSALGSEVGYFVKTDVTHEMQEAMYNALMDKTALYENVHIDALGNPDFVDESLCGNGRAVIQMNKLKIHRGRRKHCIAAKTINLPSLENLDELVFAFITRRNTIMPFAQRLTPEQGVLAYLWGESTHSFATRPEKAGDSVRIVGTDDFIIGSRARKTNRFFDIVMTLVDRFPGRVKFFQYNTGGVGEVIEITEQGGKKVKHLKRKVARVPINIMSAIQRGDLRGTSQYRPGRFGTEEIFALDDEQLSEYDVDRLYSKDQIDTYLKDIVEGRRKFTEEIAREGLNPKILKLAEQSFSIAPRARTWSMANLSAPKKDVELPSWRPPVRTRTPRFRSG
ncbi:phosphoenolpyruvate carboxykinase (ATP) [Acidobacteriota bacterium]